MVNQKSRVHNLILLYNFITITIWKEYVWRHGSFWFPWMHGDKS
jgi:hypothetical protein